MQAIFENKPFWSGSVNLLDGKIEEVHSYLEAQAADFHHSIYFSQQQIEKMSNGECAFFWINNSGEIEGLWRDEINDEIIKKIAEQITFYEKTKKDRRDTLSANIYILSGCDAWAGKDSMRTLGVTTDKTMLYAMLAAKIKAGDMEYGGYDGEEAWRYFQKDFKNEEVNFNKLQYGFVQTYEDMQITEPISLAEFPEAAVAYKELTGTKAKAELEKLELDSRTLVYSMVEVRTDFGYTCFLIPGICDRNSLESDDHFREFMGGTTESDVNASVSFYSVGSGESVYPDEDELAIIEQYTEELDDEYGIDHMESYFISFYYEAEQEY